MIHVCVAIPMRTRAVAPDAKPNRMVMVSGNPTVDSKGRRKRDARPLRNTFSARKYPIKSGVQHNGCPSEYKMTTSVIPKKLISTTKYMTMRIASLQLVKSRVK